MPPARPKSLIDLPPLPEPVPAREIRTVDAQGVTVAFDNVRLTWDASRGPALDGLSFRVAAGETLVLAGPSGAGKSSVIEILLGFVRPDSGRVTINGADITDLVPQALSRLTAWIGQRPVLFSGSIRDNILFARPEASAEEVTAAATAARLDGFVAGLPAGLDTMIGEGGYGLSGGQAQRVAIARAYLKNAPLLLLDEPTAHLDPATEQEVLDSLRRLALGRTVILASHSAAAHGFGGRRLDLRDGRVDPGAGGGIMSGPLFRIMGLWGRQAGWLLAGLAVSLAALIAGVGLMALSGFTIGAAVFAAGLPCRRCCAGSAARGWCCAIPNGW